MISTMPAGVPDRLEQLLAGLQENISVHLQRQQEMAEKRWKQDPSRIAEEEAAEESALEVWSHRGLVTSAHH